MSVVKYSAHISSGILPPIDSLWCRTSSIDFASLNIELVTISAFGEGPARPANAAGVERVIRGLTQIDRPSSSQGSGWFRFRGYRESLRYPLISAQANRLLAHVVYRSDRAHEHRRESTCSPISKHRLFPIFTRYSDSPLFR